MYDANARFYDPELGQFTQPDSLVPEPYHPISLNRYAYTYNSPVNFTDSSGHFIDTLWDAFDLGANLRNCLGDTDSLSCYMVPLAAAAMMVPGATMGPADNVVRAGRGAEAVKPLTRRQALDRMEEIRKNAGEQLVLFRGTSAAPNSPDALRASKFRTDPRTVEQIAFELSEFDWDQAVTELGAKHADSSLGSPFLSSSPMPITALKYSSLENIWPTSGYIIAFSVDDPLRLPRRNPRPHRVDKIEYLVPVGITSNDIVEIISVRKDWFDFLSNYTKLYK